MRTPRISELLVAAALIGAPSAAALAEPATAAHVSAAVATPSKAPTSRTDADRYAARETKNTSVKDFRGGSGMLYVGGGAFTVLLIVVLVLVLA